MKNDDVQGYGWRSASFAGVRLLAGMMLAVGFLATAVPAANAETRTLRLYFIHTKEHAEIAYKRNGRYIQSGLREVNRFLRDWRRNEPTNMDPQLLDLLWEVYRASGSRDYVHVVSAYRSPQTNAMLRSRSNGVAKKSQHMLGKAIDFYLPDVKLSRLRAVALKYEAGGVGYYPRSGAPFIHIDVGGVRHWPRMSRRELAAVFPDGKTVHVPSDGKPLPGYQQALASYEARKSSGNLVPGSGSSGGRGRGLLAALFGGGADEEEDNVEATTRVAAAPQRATRQAAPQAAPSAAAPTEAAPPPAETPATILAALPQRSVPVPQAAPRPDTDAPEQLPFQVKPTPSADEIPVGKENAPTPADGAVQLLAANVPLPTRRPDHVLAVSAQKPEISSETPVQVASAAGGAPDAMAEVLTGATVTDADADADRPIVTAAYLPLPSNRPGADGEEKFSLAAMPAARPVSLMEDEPVELQAKRNALTALEAEGSDGRISASQRLALLKNVDAEPAVVISSGVHTTGKAAKPGRADLQPPVKPVVLPVKVSAMQRALKHESMLTKAEDIPRPPSFDSEFVRSPKTVYTTSFQQDVVVADAQRFTGKAVNFITMARFRTN